VEIRLQKILAESGWGSRRETEKIILAGRVAVNGKTVLLGSKADPETDVITVDAVRIKRLPKKIYIAVNKPRGVISEYRGERERKHLIDIVQLDQHLFSVGRLDADSEGLVLLTNDGELANLLTHPRYGHEKEYRVLISSVPDGEQLEIWRRGVVLKDGYRTRAVKVFKEAAFGKGTWLRIIMKEGRKRQIREVARTLGLHVVKLIRIRVASITLGKLKSGEWRYLGHNEMDSLKQFTEKSPTSTTSHKPQAQKGIS
jgi:23S rRNA pseudouridine2605 synthase